MRLRVELASPHSECHSEDPQFARSVQAPAFPAPNLQKQANPLNKTQNTLRHDVGVAVAQLFFFVETKNCPTVHLGLQAVISPEK
jgi:hypothetical protein